MDQRDAPARQIGVLYTRGMGGGGAEKQIVSVVRKGNLRRVLGYCEGEADYRSNSVLGVVTTILVIETPRSIS